MRRKEGEGEARWCGLAGEVVFDRLTSPSQSGGGGGGESESR